MSEHVPYQVRWAELGRVVPSSVHKLSGSRSRATCCGLKVPARRWCRWVAKRRFLGRVELVGTVCRECFKRGRR